MTMGPAMLLGAAAAVLIVILLIIALRMWMREHKVQGRRIAVLERQAISRNAELLLVRRDNVEHLICLHGDGGFLVEGGISPRRDSVAPAASNRPASADVAPAPPPHPPAPAANAASVPPPAPASGAAPAAPVPARVPPAMPAQPQKEKGAQSPHAVAPGAPVARPGNAHARQADAGHGASRPAAPKNNATDGDGGIED